MADNSAPAILCCGMEILERGRRVERPLHCGFCGEVIGVYEPLIHVFDRRARRTSRAAEPDVSALEGERYHLDCYESTASTR